MDKHEITPDEDLVTPERQAKGDLRFRINGRGKIDAAIPVNLTIIKELVRRRRIPYHYEIYGVGFLELQTAFRAPWAIRRMEGMLVEQLGEGLSNSQVDAMYELVCRALGKERIDVIQYVLETKERRNPKSRVKVAVERRKDPIKTYREYFDLLIEAMDAERTRVYELSIGKGFIK